MIRRGRRHAAAAIADAVAAVIAAALLAHLNRDGARITPEEARAAAHTVVEALRRDGWHVTAHPPS